MSIVINVDGTNRVKSIDRNSLKIYNILTRQVDTCRFTIRRYGATHTFEPIVGMNVSVTDGGTTIFAGNIVKITQGSDQYPRRLYEVECHDYGRQLDRYLVNTSFTNKTVSYIIDYILADKDLDDAGYTTNNVDCDKDVAYIAFKYEPFSSVLTQLADLINYDWYVDFNKDIHFFSKTTSLASFDVQDDDGSYVFDSLRIRRDNSQVKNVIYVRGGEYLGSSFTSEFQSVNVGGVEVNVFSLPYRYSSESFKVNVTGEIWDHGVDGIGIEGAFDCMWNNEEKFIRLRDDRIPTDGASIKVSGEPYLPVIVKVRDQDAIDTMTGLEGAPGEYEHIIIDKSINSREGARERAVAELDSYKETLSEAEFKTYNTGLKAGQRIRINSSAHGVDEYFIINRVVYVPRTPDTFVYHVSLVTTKTSGIIDFLRGLLDKEKKKIIINEDEILDKIETFDEEISIAETISRVTEEDILEPFSISESIRRDPFNPPDWVLGLHTVTGDSDTSRDMYLDVTSYLY